MDPCLFCESSAATSINMSPACPTRIINLMYRLPFDSVIIMNKNTTSPSGGQISG